MISDKNIKAIEVDQGVIDQRPKRVKQSEVKNNPELHQKKRELENKLDQALMKNKPTADIHREIESIERQIKERQRIEKLQEIRHKKDNLKEAKESIVDFRKQKDLALKKLNDELLPELEEKKQLVSEARQEVNKVKRDINRFRILIPDEKRKISDLSKELKELKNNL